MSREKLPGWPPARLHSITNLHGTHDTRHSMHGQEYIRRGGRAIDHLAFPLLSKAVESRPCELQLLGDHVDEMSA